MADGTDKSGLTGQASKKVDAETARLEVEKFLDLKRVPASKREGDFEGSIETLETLVTEGRMVFDFDKKRAIFKLLVPLEAKQSGNIKELSMRFFIGMQSAQNILKKIDAGDIYGRSLAMAAELSGINPSLLSNAKNDVEEYGLDISDANSLLFYITFFLG